MRSEAGSLLTDERERPIYFAETPTGFASTLLLAFPSFLYLLLTYVLPPPLPNRPDSLLDPSWHIILTDAFLKGSQFGRDLIYTYGPWGFLEVARGNPAIYPWLVFGRLLLTVPFVLAVSSIAARKIAHNLGQHILVASVVLLGDPALVLPVLLGALLLDREEQRSRPRLLIHTLALVCALTVWIKFTGFVIVGLLAAALGVQDLMRRRLPLIAIEIGACSLVWWLLAGQALSTLPAYIHGSLSVARSYSSEMFVSGPEWELVVAGFLVAAIAVPLAAYAYRANGGVIWLSLGWFCLLFLLQLKEAFVRHDSFHIWMGIINVLLPSALLLLCVVGAFDSAAQPVHIGGVIQKLCVALVLCLSVLFPIVELFTPAGIERVQTLGIHLSALEDVLAGESLSTQHQKQQREFQRIRPLARVSGTATFFPDSASLLYGNDLSRRLPPSPQAFAAYNAQLSGLNASFYRSAARPDFIFFDVLPIDERYPTSSDSLSWLAFLDCYAPDRYSGALLVLRSHPCRNAPIESIGESTAQIEQAIDVPAADRSAIWVQFDMRMNLAGSLIGTLARPPLTRLRVRTDAGEKIFRISPEAGRTGFLLSPLMMDPASFERLFRDVATDPATQVRQMSVIETPIGHKLFQSGLRVRFFRVPLPTAK